MNMKSEKEKKPLGNMVYILEQFLLASRMVSGDSCLDFKRANGCEETFMAIIEKLTLEVIILI